MTDEEKHLIDEAAKLKDQVTDDDSRDDDEVEEVTKSEEFQKAVERRAEEKVQKLKKSLDVAYDKLKEQTKELTKVKAQEQELKKRKMEEEGKHLELKEIELTELREKLRIAEERYLKSSRDSELQSALSGLEFRNDYARKVAFDELKSRLEQDEDGTWYHSDSGVPLKEYVKTFAKDPQREILFKPKENLGSGTQKTENKGTGPKGRPSSLVGLSSEELLKLAEEGRLGQYNY